MNRVVPYNNSPLFLLLLLLLQLQCQQSLKTIPSPFLIKPTTLFAVSTKSPQKGLDARAINKEITTIFGASNLSTTQISRLSGLLFNNKENINAVNVVTLMHRCTKRRKRLLDFVSQEVVMNRLSERWGVFVCITLPHLTSFHLTWSHFTFPHSQLTSQGIANALYGIHGIALDSVNQDQQIYNSSFLVSVLDILAKQIENSLECNWKLIKYIFTIIFLNDYLI